MQYIIKTEGLHCGHCDASVETELTEGEVAAEALAGAVVAAGFKALSVEAA